MHTRHKLCQLLHTLPTLTYYTRMQVLRQDKLLGPFLVQTVSVLVMGLPRLLGVTWSCVCWQEGTVHLWQSGFSKSTTIETISVPGNQAYMPVSTVLCLGAKINWHNVCHVRTCCHYQKCINVLLSAVTCMDY